MFDRRLLKNFDWILLLLLIIISAISVLNLYSATYPLRQAGGSVIFMKQIYWFIIGFAALLFMTTFDYHLLGRLAYPAYFFALALLIVVLLKGEVRSGSQRWLSLGGVMFQPAELMKIALVIALARFFSEHDHPNGYRLRDLWRPFLLMALPCGLIIKEPDLGTALTIGIVCFSVILFAKVRLKSLLILVIGAFLAAPFIWVNLQEYQQKRILTYLSPEMDPLGAGYHINQSKIAIGSGLVWGKGFLQGTQTRLHFLPEQHTDFAFSVLAEEWGFAGSLILLLLYLFLMLWGINIARTSKDKFGALISLGVVAIIFWQMAINVSMVTGLLPVVGIPLVLFSYGGSSIVSTMAGMGLLMNISMRRFMFQ
ncbi:MAG: rod shape-determining protein RodA [Deltaproteobacteria bacterium]|nr:rod shape-determining protein RodA [Deltaproteobacteria bacterium]MBW1920855.1 rod shape-determining protein RodA [Deltaproteobacteria bacterium]MBW1935343.1 rod shape-determining protein RodA [Deltaproteobacteria bacterium]MBW1976782.1 rod shape-determining protein RodA [Deltaproteobacteria bacterium]MBW2043645.1 rod shape-determining protein RodA [Deltaproteobacteria bacterium]